jgi:beta-ureidopropionase / N-carbamoyl-L-amino-acid hydrolase
VFTFGQMYTNAKVHNLAKVPGEVSFTLDIRSGDPEVLAMMKEFVLSAAERISQSRCVRFDLGAFSAAEATVLDPVLQKELHAGSEALSLGAIDIASGGGHDAQEFAKAGVASAMIFIRNDHGSHVAEEAMALSDLELGTRLLTWRIVTDR